MNETTAQEDLAYVRAIAEEGRNVPLVGGPMFFVWGGVIGTAALVAFFKEIGVIGSWLSPLWLWSVALGLGWMISMIVGARMGKVPGSTTAGNKVANVAWLSCGIFMTVFWLSILAAWLIAPEGGFPMQYLFAAMFSVAFGVYGVAFMVTAVAANQSWMRWVAIGSWVMSSLFIFALNTKLYMLVAALATYAVVLVPGVILIRAQPSSTV